MATEPVGITFIVPENQDAIGVYEVEGGVEVFETDEPYLLSDGKSLVDPMPVRMVDGPIYQDTLGNAQSALAITLVSSWSPADLFANGEQGSLWGPLPYYSDAAGTVEADWGDPVGNIPDASGNGTAWAQVTSTARPILGRVPVGLAGQTAVYTRDLTDTSNWVENAPNQYPDSVTYNHDGVSGEPNTATRIVDSSSRLVFLRQTVPTVNRAAPYSVRAWVKKEAQGGDGFAEIHVRQETTFNLGGIALGLNKETGETFARVDSGISSYQVDDAGEWWRITIEQVVSGGTVGPVSYGIGPSVTTTLGGVLSNAATGAVTIGNFEFWPGKTLAEVRYLPPVFATTIYDQTSPGVNAVHYLRFDGTDDQVTTTLPAISGGTIVLAGTNGIWIDSLDFAGGEFSVGPGTYTGGPAGLMSILGDILVEGGFVIDRALTPKEIAQVKKYYKARGAGDFVVPLDTSVVAVIRPTVDTAPANWIRYHNGKSYPDGPEWQGIIDTHPAYAGIASEVIDSQHMVKVPKFYVQTKDTAAGGVIYAVSDRALTGFDTHPAFYNLGDEIDQFWIGAYHASEVSNVFESQPNVLPRVSLSGVTAIERMEARNTGGQTGWGSLTWHQICAVKLLCLIEIGTPNSRAAIGQGWNNSTSNSGSGHELQPTGTSDANWRGIYDLWGNVHTLCTGLELRDGRIWLADENGDLVDTGYDMPAERYIGACSGGVHAWAFLTAEVGPNAFNAGYASRSWTNLTGTRVARHGGSFADSVGYVGLFSLNSGGVLGHVYVGSGFRLAKV